MQKRIVFAVCGCLMSLAAYAQSSDLEAILQQVEQNNKELQALSSYVESKKLELRYGNNLPDPQLSAFYLPFGDHVGSDYSEFQLSQSFEFPSVYGARGQLIDEQIKKLELEYQVKRQEVLLKAKQNYLEIIYLNKRLSLEEQRMEQSRTVFEQVQELFDKEQVGILEVNKAKVAWMQVQFKVGQVRADQESLHISLKELNGNIALEIDQSDYLPNLELETQESLWQDKLSKDPVLASLQQLENIAQQQLSLAKNTGLPNLTAGFNRQGIAGGYYSGVYAGISIPLWSNKNKVPAANAQLEYQKVNSSAQTLKAEVLYQKEFKQYGVLLDRYQEYEATLSGLNSDELLLQAYQLGEISFLEYHMELRFYREAYDALLRVELELHQSKAELLKHQL